MPAAATGSPMTVLVTGAAGFIGAYTCQALAARGERVVGLDNHNDYYDPQLKRDRVAFPPAVKPSCDAVAVRNSHAWNDNPPQDATPCGVAPSRKLTDRPRETLPPPRAAAR